MPKDKLGNKLTWKEYMGKWKQGIEGITPMQQVVMQIKSTWIMVIGILLGIVMCIIGIRNLWWLMIILIGALGNTSMQLVGLIQKKRMLQAFEFNIDLMKGGNNNNDNER